MKYIATFYSHFGAIRFKREAPEGVTNIELRPVPRNLSSSCGTSASLMLVKVLLSQKIQQRRLNKSSLLQRVAIKLYMKVRTNNFEIQILHYI